MAGNVYGFSHDNSPFCLLCWLRLNSAFDAILSIAQKGALICINLKTETHTRGKSATRLGCRLAQN